MFKLILGIKNNEMNQNTPLNISPEELKKWLDDDLSNPILIDVREKEELVIASLPRKVLHLPLSEHLDWIDSYAKHLSFHEKLVVICHSGIRSWNFATWLLEQDSRYQVWNLNGGIDAWSQKIDNSVPRY